MTDDLFVMRQVLGIMALLDEKYPGSICTNTKCHTGNPVPHMANDLAHDAYPVNMTREKLLTDIYYGTTYGWDDVIMHLARAQQIASTLQAKADWRWYTSEILTDMIKSAKSELRQAENDTGKSHS